MSDLTERLRSITTCGCDEDQACSIGREAADRIEALERQNAGLIAAIRTADHHLTNMQPHIEQKGKAMADFIDVYVDEACAALRPHLAEWGAKERKE